MPHPHPPSRPRLNPPFPPFLYAKLLATSAGTPTPSEPLPKPVGRNPALSPSGPRWSKPAASHGPAQRRWGAAQTRGSGRSGCGRRPRSSELGPGPVAVAATATPSRRGAEETPAQESLGARRDGRGRRPWVGRGEVPGPASRRPPGTQLREPGEAGSLDPREPVNWWWERGDSGDTRKET